MGNRNPFVRSSFPVLDDGDDCSYRLHPRSDGADCRQMLSIGLLLSIDNYYNNKVCKVIKGRGNTPCIPGLKEHCPVPSLQGLSSGAHAASFDIWTTPAQAVPAAAVAYILALAELLSDS